MEREIQLPYGDDTLKLRVPEANLAGVYAPQPVAACTDPAAEILRALNHPLDTPPLSDIVQPNEKVVILVDDHTRATPVAQILPPLLM
jgi:nickel-dependent lactate racemase